MSATAVAPSVTVAAFCAAGITLVVAVDALRRRAVRRRADRAIVHLRHGAGERGPDRFLERLRTRGVLRFTRHRRSARVLDLATLLDATARRCASGHSLTTALIAALPPGPDPHELAVVADALNVGTSLPAALGRVGPVDSDLRLAVHVLSLCATQGGGIAESLDRAAATLRERQAARDERTAHSAQARLSAKVLTVVPLLFAAWTTVTTDSVRAFVTSPLGGVCVTLGIALNIAGWSLMQRAIRSIG
jgi:tight adherence protein B